MPFDPFTAAGFDDGATPSPPTAPTGVVPSIDVGTPTPDARPGEMGSQFRPVVVAPRAKPGAPPPAQAVTPPPAAPAPAAAPPVTQAPGAVTAAPATPPPDAPSPPRIAPDDPFKAAGFPDKPPIVPPPKMDGSSPHSDEPWYQHLGTKVGTAIGAMASGQGLHEAAHSFTLGFDDIVGPLVPAIANSIVTGKPFVQSYQENANAWAKAREDWERANPMAADVMSGIGMAGSMFVPFGAAARAATTAGRLVRGVGTGIGVGAAGGFGLTEGDITTAEGLEQRAKGAAIGGVAGGALAPIAEVAPRVLRNVAGIVRPSSQTDRLAGQVLVEHAPGAVRPPAVPGVPLSTAEATASPSLSALTQTRESLVQNIPQRVRRESLQSQRLRTAMPGHIPGTPGAVATDASTRAERVIRRAQEISAREERRLWNKPSMSRPNVSTHTTKAEVNDLASSIRDNEPGLMTDALNHPSIQSVIRAANALPDHAAANQINGIASQFGRIARTWTLPGEVRATAGRLQRAAQDGLWTAPEVAGSPAQVIPRGWRTDPSGQMVWHNGGTVPAVRPNPQLVRDMREARTFTQREAHTLGHANFDAIFSRNSYGNQTLTPGSGLNRFFNFNTGRMSQGSIRDVDQFLGDIGTQWRRLGDPAFNAADAAMVRGELAQNTREWLTASLLDKISHVSNEDLTGNRMLQMGKTRAAIQRNRTMLERSGVYTQAQMDMWDRIAETAGRIHDTAFSGRPINSATYTRLTSDSRFMDLLFGGQLARIMTSGTLGSVAGGFVSHALGLGEYGGAIIGDIAGMGVQALAERLYGATREQVLARLDEALNDPQIAQDLMQRVGRSAQWSDKTRRWVTQVMAITGAHVGAAYAPEPEGAQSR